MLEGSTVSSLESNLGGVGIWALVPATFGVTGSTGSTGFVGVRRCTDDVVGLDDDGGTADCGGVAGMLESVSDGASEVAGVSISERAATVDVCDSVCSSVVSPPSMGGSTSSSAAISTSACGIAGSCKAASGSAACLSFRRR